MAWYEVYRNDKQFIKRYESKPHLYKTHEKYFNSECNDDYLAFANSYHPGNYKEWRESLKGLFNYEKDLYAKVDKHDNLIIISYYNLDGIVRWDYKTEDYRKYSGLIMRFIYDTETTEMYHYRMKNFKQFAYVLNTCDNTNHMGGWTDFDKFYSQYQRTLDDHSIKILKSLESFKYLPIESFNKISVYNLFQISDDAIYQYEILLKNDLTKLASDMLLSRSFITTEYFKQFKNEIMGGIRLKELNRLIWAKERKEQEQARKLEKKKKIDLFAAMPKSVYEYEDYIIRHPLNYKELEHEGRELHHCVASYLDRIVDKDIEILFLRKKSDPDTPYFTIELRNKSVVQVRTFKNKTEPDITKLVESWRTYENTNHKNQ